MSAGSTDGTISIGRGEEKGTSQSLGTASVASGGWVDLADAHSTRRPPGSRPAAPRWLATSDGRVVFVRGALPGERVRVAVTDERRSYASAHVAEVLEAAPERTVPPCPHVAEGCGGCDWQHVAPDAQPGLRAAIVRDALTRIGGIEAPTVAEGEPLPTEGFRTTVRGAVVDDRFAYRRWHSHDPLAVDSCLIAHPLRRGGHRGGSLPWRPPGLDPGRGPDGGAAGGGRPLPPRTWWCPTGWWWSGRDRTAAGPAGLVPRGGRRPHVADLGHLLLPVPPGRRRAARRRGPRARPPTSHPRPGRSPTCAPGVGLFAGTIGEGRPVIAVERDRSAVADARHNLAGEPARDRAGVGRELAARPGRSRGGRPAPHRPGSQGSGRGRRHPGPRRGAGQLRPGRPRAATPGCWPRPATATPGRPSWTCSRTPPTSRR